ncbi:MAG: transcriptional regulator, partial [Moraxellaceae bacterium]
LVTGQNQYEVAFQRITSGGKVIEHDHRGLEVTLVLHGSFSDEGGVYNEGDFLVRNPGDVHRPTATQNQDCLCLSVTEAPVSVTGFFGKFINPFLTIKPA